MKHDLRALVQALRLRLLAEAGTLQGDERLDERERGRLEVIREVLRALPDEGEGVKP